MNKILVRILADENPYLKEAKVFRKRVLEDTITDFQTIDLIDAKIDYYFRMEQVKGVDNFDKIIKLLHEKNTVHERARKRVYPSRH